MTNWRDSQRHDYRDPLTLFSHWGRAVGRRTPAGLGWGGRRGSLVGERRVWLTRGRRPEAQKETKVKGGQTCEIMVGAVLA